MTNESKSSPLLYVLVTLVCINLVVTGYIALNLHSANNAAIQEQDKDQTKNVSAESANLVAEPLVRLYNEKQHSKIYELFDDLAKVQFTEETLKEQIEKVYKMVGRVDKFIYSHSEYVGVVNGKQYYNLHFQVKLSGSDFTKGSMKVTVVDLQGKYGLIAFFVNGSM
ncbi:hypothetical protein KCM76_16960 [Zooshikella marina]|uniref:hypothetical protein n=2 Tax=Zooshikella ganghwensis TaxID=202772 RepID=UPI001BB04AA4|nr:hypothetical protein [Zooshikella ganghwensis]MBU2707685.1 hypothetical protein [Zooshikella ganghwensis]